MVTYLKNMIIFNDQFPGPMIEANWGDYIEGKSHKGSLYKRERVDIMGNFLISRYSNLKSTLPLQAQALAEIYYEKADITKQPISQPWPYTDNYNKPLLLLAQKKNQTYEPEWNVIQPENSKTVRLIINNNSTISHVSITPSLFT